MREKFGPENADEVEYHYRRLTQPCPHLLKRWLDNNENLTVGEIISVQCSRCGGSFSGTFRGYYELGQNDKGEPFILCKVCGMMSFHPKDIENRFCANCRRFYK